MFFKGALACASPFRKLIFTVGMMLTISFLLSLLSFLLIKIFFGIDLFSNQNYLDNLHDPLIVNSLKLLQILSGSLGLFIIPSLISAYFFDEKPISYLHLNKRILLFSLLLVLFISIASMPVINWLVSLNSHLSLPAPLYQLELWMRNSENQAARITEAFLRGETLNTLWFNIFIIALLPAIGEELLFRGILQRIFTQMLKNAHAAIIITSIIFSAFHFQFYGFLPRMVLGIFLGYLLIWSGSLWLPIAAHFLNNAIAVFLVHLHNQNKLGFNPDTLGTLPDERFYFWLCFFVIIILLILLYKNNTRPVKQ